MLLISISSLFLFSILLFLSNMVSLFPIFLYSYFLLYLSISLSPSTIFLLSMHSTKNILSLLTNFLLSFSPAYLSSNTMTNSTIPMLLLLVLYHYYTTNNLFLLYYLLLSNIFPLSILFSRIHAILLLSILANNSLLYYFSNLFSTIHPYMLLFLSPFLLFYPNNSNSPILVLLLSNYLFYSIFSFSFLLSILSNN